MSPWAKKIARRGVTRTAFLVVPLIALSACASKEDDLAEKLAAAEAAAEKAVAAQKAAEKAASIAAGFQSAPPAAEPTVMADTQSENDFMRDNEEERFHHDSESEFSMGGSGQTISPDGVVIPGQGV